MATRAESNGLPELERELSQLWDRLSLPTSLRGAAAPSFATAVDGGFLDLMSSLVGSLERERPALETLLAGTPAGRRLWTVAQLDQLRRAAAETAGFMHEGPFGVREWVFPVRVRGAVLHVVRSPPHRAAPFSPEEVAEIGTFSGRPLPQVRAALSAIPVDVRGLESSARLHAKALGDAVQRAFEEHLRAGEAAAGAAAETGSLGMLAEGMAKHLNNVLSVVLGYASLLADREKLGEAGSEAIKRIQEAAQRGRRFTQEILALAQSTPGEPARVVPLHERVQATLQLLQPRHPGLRIKTRLQARNDRIAGPPGLIQQMLLNLLDGCLSEAGRDGQIEVATENTLEKADGSTWLRLTVGKSAPAGTRRPPETGAAPLSGLFAYVGQLDGNVVVEPAAGDGRIVLQLPVSTKKADTEVDRRMRPRLAPSAIWVADDDEVIRTMCRHVLSAEGHAVEELASAEAVDDRLAGAGRRPDLIIYDFSMPDRGGLEFCQGLRDGGVRTPVLLLSGLKPSHPEIAAALRLRKAFFLQKPFTSRDLSDGVSIAMGDTLVGA